MDHKCVQSLTGGGCWYCELNCEMCMKPFSPGFLIHMPADDSTTFKFCGKECQDLFRYHPHAVAVLSLSGDPLELAGAFSENFTVTENKTALNHSSGELFV